MAPADLYAAHIRFLSDGTLTVRVWLVPERGRQPAVELPRPRHPYPTHEGADRIDQACYYIGQSLRERRDDMAHRARTAALMAQAAKSTSRATATSSSTGESLL